MLATFDIIIIVVHRVIAELFRFEIGEPRRVFALSYRVNELCESGKG